MTQAHLATRTLTESIWYPEHDPRKASKLYRKVHHRLVYELDEPCWICGVRHSDGGEMETHHWHVEWALANRIDPKKIIKDFPFEMWTLGGTTPGTTYLIALRRWLDSEGNMLVLCSACHRHGLVGIHSITYPAWVAQRWLKDGHDISEGA